jgi:hypothetical protein
MQILKPKYLFDSLELHEGLKMFLEMEKDYLVYRCDISDHFESPLDYLVNRKLRVVSDFLNVVTFEIGNVCSQYLMDIVEQRLEQSQIEKSLLVIPHFPLSSVSNQTFQSIPKAILNELFVKETLFLSDNPDSEITVLKITMEFLN